MIFLAIKLLFTVYLHLAEIGQWLTVACCAHKLFKKFRVIKTLQKSGYCWYVTSPTSEGFPFYINALLLHHNSYDHFMLYKPGY